MWPCWFSLQMNSRKGLLVVFLILLLHIAAFFITSLIQTAEWSCFGDFHIPIFNKQDLNWVKNSYVSVFYSSPVDRACDAASQWFPFENKTYVSNIDFVWISKSHKIGKTVAMNMYPVCCWAAHKSIILGSGINPNELEEVGTQSHFQTMQVHENIERITPRSTH